LADATVLAVIAVGLLGAAGVVWYRGWRFLASATSANAEVVAVLPYQENRTTRHAQVCRFEVAGQTVEANLKAGLPYEVGARLDVFFDPAHPERIRVKSQVYRPVVVLLVFAGLATIAWVGAK